jgi:hypothetical protein
MLPYHPEPLEALQARYPKALEPIFDVRDWRPGWPVPVSWQRRHVFDHDDGLRLIVSRDRLADAVRLHVSASLAPGSPLDRELLRRLRRGSRRKVCVGWLIPLVERRFAQLSDTPLVFHALSPGTDLLHWFDAPLPKEVPDG